MRNHNEIQHAYTTRKIQTGYKRTQIWTLDVSNKSVQQRIKLACMQINQDNPGNDIVDEISAYTHSLLQDTSI